MDKAGVHCLLNCLFKNLTKIDKNWWRKSTMVPNSDLDLFFARNIWTTATVSAKSFSWHNNKKCMLLLSLLHLYKFPPFEKNNELCGCGWRRRKITKIRKIFEKKLFFSFLQTIFYFIWNEHNICIFTAFKSTSSCWTRFNNS